MTAKHIPAPKLIRQYLHCRRYRIEFREVLVRWNPPVFRLVKFYERRNPTIPGGWEQLRYVSHENPRATL